jgi:DNA adenine methylase
VKPPFSYFGGKTRLAPWIASLLPPHRVYLEPFFGSGAVLFAKTPAAQEIANDIDDNIVTFFRVLRDRPDELVSACRLTPYARAEYDACYDRSRELPELERARRAWVRIAQAFAGATGDHHRNSWSVSASGRVADAIASQRLIDRMHAAAARLAAVAIDNRPAVDVIAQFGVPGAVIYADPPYLAATRRSSERGTRVARDYAHDMSGEEAHRHLAAALNATRAVVFLSGYPSPLYDELYSGWHRAERAMRVDSANRVGKPKKSAVEVLWSNRPISSQTRLFDVIESQEAS